MSIVLDLTRYEDPLERALFAKDFVNAFKNKGFCYLKNHGVAHETLESAFTTAKEFFDLPKEEKRRLINITERVQRTSFNPIYSETLYGKAKEFKESLDFIPGDRPDVENPAINAMLDHFTSFFDLSKPLIHKLLHSFAIGLGLDDEEFFIKQHRKMGHGDQTTLVRLIHYPPIENGEELASDATRLAPHTDWGGVTILFQDDVGGLEIESGGGHFVQATPIPDTCVVNLGSLMERWTNGELRAALHRVRSDDPATRSKHRQAVIIFVDPDLDSLVEPIGDRKNYEPILAADYMRHRYAEAFEAAQNKL